MSRAAVAAAVARRRVGGGGGGGGLALVDSNGNLADETTSVTAALTLASAGPNRYLAAGLLITDFSGGAEDGMTFNSDALTQIGTEDVFGSGFVMRTSLFDLIAPDAADANLVGNATTGPPFVLISMGAAYSGVNQSTPRGTVYLANGTINSPSASGSASVEVSDALTGDTILCFVYIRDSAAGAPTITAINNSGTILTGETAAAPHRLTAIEFVAGSDAPTISMTITTSNPDEVFWQLRAFKINPA